MLYLVGPAAATEFPVVLKTPEMEDRFRAMYEAGRLSELIDPHAFLDGLSSDWPVPPYTEWPRPRLGTVYWPVVGLARYAYACLLVDEHTIGQLRTQMTAAGSDVVLLRSYDDPDDGAEVPREVSLHFLASRPLSRTIATDPALTPDADVEMDAWVLLLVDDRYAVLHRTNMPAVTTWTDVFGAITIDGSSDAVDAAYITPDAVRWAASRTVGRSVAWLLDIAAAFVGSRFVSTPGALPMLQRPTAGNATALATAHATYAADERFDFGGPVVDADVSYGYPHEVRVIFANPLETSPTAVTVAGPGAGNLSLGTWVDPASSIGAGPRSTLATKWKADWLAWQRAQIDTTYSGFVPVARSGFLWAVEWLHDSDRGLTKFYRPPHYYGYLLAPRYGMTGGSSPTPGCGLTLDGSGNLAIDYPSVVGQGLQVQAGVGCDKLAVHLGCNLAFGTGDKVDVDVASLAGQGLVPTAVSGCYRLDVGAGCGINVNADDIAFKNTDVAGDGLTTAATCKLKVNPGCGLGFDASTPKKLLVDLTGVVTDPLEWVTGSSCHLNLKYSCGLELLAGELAVDVATLAGARVSTALIPVNVGGCDVFSVDLVNDHTTTETLVNDIAVSIAPSGALKFDVTKTVYTNHFNLAGLLINRTAAAPTVATQIVIPCEACCPCASGGVQDYTAAGTFTFTATCSGVHRVRVWGAGGGGFAIASRLTGYGGGGGGAYAESWVCLTSGTNYTVFVSAANAETASTFANGTTVQVVAEDGKNMSGATGGAGGSAAGSHGDIVRAGGKGGNSGIGLGGGGGGGAGDIDGVGLDGQDGVGCVGGGHGDGGPPDGGIAGGHVGDGGNGGNCNASGVGGALYGGGGGGAGATGINVNGNGAYGRVRITW